MAIGRECVNCHSKNDLTYHHIVPLNLGGHDEISNMVCLCRRCHSLIHYGDSNIMAHSDAIKRGIKKAQAKGIKVGKKPVDEEKAVQTIAENSTQFNCNSLTTEGEIMKMLGIKATAYHKYKRRLISALFADEWPYSFAKPKMIAAHPTYERVLLKARGMDCIRGITSDAD